MVARPVAEFVITYFKSNIIIKSERQNQDQNLWRYLVLILSGEKFVDLH
jgi:hypothetical protein